MKAALNYAGSAARKRVNRITECYSQVGDCDWVYTHKLYQLTDMNPPTVILMSD